MTEWQPIKTAPRDGTFVRIKFGDDTEDEDGPYIARCWDDDGTDGDYWTDENKLDFAYGTAHPTHWMPLSDPPKAA